MSSTFKDLVAGSEIDFQDRGLHELKGVGKWRLYAVSDEPVSAYSSVAAELPLFRAGGEPVDFARTIVSHGVAELPPNRVDLEQGVLETTLPIPRGARTVRVTAAGRKLRIETVKGSVHEQLRKTVAHMFRLDEDLSPFYAAVDEDLAWCAFRAGRMLRAPTVFEDVVKRK